MQITKGDPALVLTGPQNAPCSPAGVTWEPVGDLVTESGTVERIEQMLVAAKDSGTRVFVSPYSFPHDRNGGRAVLCSPRTVYGSEQDDVVLQLPRRGVNGAVLDGMSASPTDERRDTT